MSLYNALQLESIELAQALIMEGRVMAGDRKVRHVGELLNEGERLRVKGKLDPYVSRGAYKLKKALEVFHIDLQQKTCIDVGASTGGFTDVMLRAGAARVYAVDVGYNLLDYRLRSDPRVTCLERTNARFLSANDFSPKPTFGATDVSFISLKMVLPPALYVLEADRSASFVALVKPQFEAPKEEVGEKGVVRDRQVHESVLREITEFVPSLGWKVSGLDYSPIRGPEGNIEFLLYITRSDNSDGAGFECSIDATICRAYDKFFKSSTEAL